MHIYIYVYTCVYNRMYNRKNAVFGAGWWQGGVECFNNNFDPTIGAPELWMILIFFVFFCFTGKCSD